MQHQEDAHEFLCYLIESMERSCLTSLSRDMLTNRIHMYLKTITSCRIEKKILFQY